MPNFALAPRIVVLLSLRVTMLSSSAKEQDVIRSRAESITSPQHSVLGTELC